MVGAGFSSLLARGAKLTRTP